MGDGFGSFFDLNLCVVVNAPYHTFKVWGKFTASHFCQSVGQDGQKKSPLSQVVVVSSRLRRRRSRRRPSPSSSCISRIDASILGRMKTSWEMALGFSSTLNLCVVVNAPYHTFKVWGKFRASHFRQSDGQTMDRKNRLCLKSSSSPVALLPSSLSSPPVATRAVAHRAAAVAIVVVVVVGRPHCRCRRPSCRPVAPLSP